MTAVMGLDLSLTGTGVAAWHPARGWHRTTITSTGHNTDTYEQTGARLERICDQIEDVRAGQRPALVVIETPAFSSASGHARDRAGLFWLVVSRLRRDWPDVAVAYCPPNTRIRYALGKGSGSKDEVLAATIKRYPDADVRNNNEADAVLLCAMGARWLADQPGFPSELRTVDKPTALCLDAIRRVQWPQALRT
jgi:crossover junction endodeoxyribonuclease RuvC